MFRPALLLAITATLLMGGTAWAQPNRDRGQRGDRVDRGGRNTVEVETRGRRNRGQVNRGVFDRGRSGRHAHVDRTSRGRAHRIASRRGSHRGHHAHGHQHGHRSKACGCVEVFRPGHYVTKRVRVQDPGYYEEVWVPAQYERRRVFGIKIKVKVCGGYYKKVYREGCVRYENQSVWVPGRYVLERRCRRHCH